jgi:hypothetical protein
MIARVTLRLSGKLVVVTFLRKLAHISQLPSVLPGLELDSIWLSGQAVQVLLSPNGGFHVRLFTNHKKYFNFKAM